MGRTHRVTRALAGFGYYLAVTADEAWIAEVDPRRLRARRQRQRGKTSLNPFNHPHSLSAQVLRWIEFSKVSIGN